MNKLQQEIMEIIQDYMDKTLSEGCLVEHLRSKEIIEIVYERPLDFYCKKADLFKDIAKICIWDKSINKIIWHYDITAVIKYITDKVGSLDGGFYGENIEFPCFWEIPNKPLHLYTEEENKDLLQLLKKLWQK